MSHPNIPATFSSGALVICEQVIVPKAENAFDDMDNLKDTRQATALIMRNGAAWDLIRATG